MGHEPTTIEPSVPQRGPELLVLRQLTLRPMHGYELVQAIRASTDHSFEFGEGCIYPILHRLEADGMLSARRETVANRAGSSMT